MAKIVIEVFCSNYNFPFQIPYPKQLESLRIYLRPQLNTRLENEGKMGWGVYVLGSLCDLEAVMEAVKDF